MVTRSRVIVFVILAFVVGIAAWSKLHYLDEDDHQPQRIPLDEHPAFKKTEDPE